MDNVFRFDNENTGFNEVITSQNSNLKYLGFAKVFLKKGEKIEHRADGQELVIILQKGDFTADILCKNSKDLKKLKGSRKNVFEEKATVLYVPPESRLIMKSMDGMEALAFSSKCKGISEPVFISPEDIEETMKGSFTWKRRFTQIIKPDSISQKIIMGESVSICGGWIGFPPHKHDVKNSTEYPLEEIFSFKLDGPDGKLGIYHSYDYEKNSNSFYAIEDDYTAIAIPDGYHYTAAVPGSRIYLLWGLAYDKKIYKIKFDPRFTWLDDVENMFEDQI